MVENSFMGIRCVLKMLESGVGRFEFTNCTPNEVRVLKVSGKNLGDFRFSIEGRRTYDLDGAWPAYGPELLFRNIEPGQSVCSELIGVGSSLRPYEVFEFLDAQPDGFRPILLAQVSIRNTAETFPMKQIPVIVERADKID